MNFNSLLRSRRSVSVTRLLICLAAATVGLQAQPTGVSLPAPAQGSAAITALGARLPDVAKAYGLRSQELVTLLQTQPSIGVDVEGALMVACEGLSVASHGRAALAPGQLAKDDGTQDAMTVNTSVYQLATGSTVDAFKLHSLPGVNRVIYLDFNGHTTSGTSWNTSFAAGNDIVSAPFDLDGSPSTFNATERALIQRIWQRVAEDYAPFAVDVTTEDPGVEALRRTDTNDSTFGVRVVISPTNWYKSTAGGVAYIGSFNRNTDTPCFAFSGQLANNEKYIAEAVSHEVGHTLGLYHDGVTSVTEYYQGHANWAPIMGVGYYKPVVQFSSGDYLNGNNKQNDLAVIATYIPLAGDDHGGTTASATKLVGSNVATGGTIETRGDVDYFRFDAAAGPISFSITGPGPDSNLDIVAELLNASGSVLQTSNPTSLGATISGTVTAGTYYLRIDGVGVGDATTGYTDYGSLGNYLIMGSFPAAATIKQAPTAYATVSSTSGTAPLTVSFSGQSSSDADGTIVSYNWNFGTDAVATGATATYTYQQAGTYTAVLTVVDNDGLSGSYAVTINVGLASNVAPVAVASASTSSGMAPLPVVFSSAGSFDSDGVISAYQWNFGDGTSSTAASPTKTYSAGGNYTVTLTVTDDRGAKASSSLVISVSSDPNTAIGVASFDLRSYVLKSGKAVDARVVIRDQLDRPVAGASVTIKWSGIASGSATGTTGADGVVVLSIQRIKKSGTLTATLTTVAAPAGASVDTAAFTAPLVRTITL
jgi:PKD repeat protein